MLDHEPAGFARIKVVGVGGGGCNAVDSMFDIGLQNVEFYVINSDLQALKRSKCPNRIQIGAEKTQGRGCGADPSLGEKCMLDAKEEMVETLRGADIVFVTAGLGGGTGTGAAPVVAQAAKELGILTVAIVTKPFQFEGPRRMKSAEAALEKFRDACDTMIVINNQRLLDVVGPKVPMKEAFKVADNVLAQAVSSISDLVCTPGLINVDFNDVRTIMGGRGGAVMGVGVGKGENRAAEAVKKATSSPLLDKIVIDGATGVLICITGGPDMSLMEVNEATQMVHEAADPDAEIIFGAVIDESMTDQLRVTIIATGFPDDVQRKQMIGAAAKPEVRTAASLFNGGHRNGNGNGAAHKPAPSVLEEAISQEAFNGIFAAEEPVAPVAVAPAPAPAPVVPAPPVAKAEPVVVAAAPAPAVEAVRPAPKQTSSLRETLEAMIRDQNNAPNGGGSQPAIRVAKSTPSTSGTVSAGLPNVRPATASGVKVGTSAAATAVFATATEPAPQVTLFDPEKEAEEERTGFDTPAFLRRRRSLFE
ncbi:cell division protein FtsZ [Candidatus Sumerlaeota bacterium]|nr:cell division protein FtsZ [Candidatus Sumerlaeota bacterium]